MAGTGLLLQYVVFFVGPILCIVYPAFYDGSPVDVPGIVLLLIWCAMCAVPLVRFVRCIGRS